MFKVGQKVVCINAKGSSELKMNEIYTIKSCWDSGHPTPTCLLFEAEPNPNTIGFDAARFRPTDDTWVDELLLKLIEEAKADELVSA